MAKSKKSDISSAKQKTCFLSKGTSLFVVFGLILIGFFTFGLFLLNRKNVAEKENKNKQSVYSENLGSANKVNPYRLNDLLNSYQTAIGNNVLKLMSPGSQPRTVVRGQFVDENKSLSELKDVRGDMTNLAKNLSENPSSIDNFRKADFLFNYYKNQEEAALNLEKIQMSGENLSKIDNLYQEAQKVNDSRSGSSDEGASSLVRNLQESFGSQNVTNSDGTTNYELSKLNGDLAYNRGMAREFAKIIPNEGADLIGRSEELSKAISGVGGPEFRDAFNKALNSLEKSPESRTEAEKALLNHLDKQISTARDFMEGRQGITTDPTTKEGLNRFLNNLDVVDENFKTGGGALGKRSENEENPYSKDKFANLDSNYQESVNDASPPAGRLPTSKTEDDFKTTNGEQAQEISQPTNFQESPTGSEVENINREYPSVPKEILESFQERTRPSDLDLPALEEKYQKLNNFLEKGEDPRSTWEKLNPFGPSLDDKIRQLEKETGLNAIDNTDNGRKIDLTSGQAGEMANKINDYFESKVTNPEKLKDYEQINPFELKDESLREDLNSLKDFATTGKDPRSWSEILNPFGPTLEEKIKELENKLEINSKEGGSEPEGFLGSDNKIHKLDENGNPLVKDPQTGNWEPDSTSDTVFLPPETSDRGDGVPVRGEGDRTAGSELIPSDQVMSDLPPVSNSKPDELLPFMDNFVNNSSSPTNGTLERPFELTKEAIGKIYEYDEKSNTVKLKDDWMEQLDIKDRDINIKVSNQEVIEALLDQGKITQEQKEQLEKNGDFKVPDNTDLVDPKTNKESTSDPDKKPDEIPAEMEEEYILNT